VSLQQMTWDLPLD